MNHLDKVKKTYKPQKVQACSWFIPSKKGEGGLKDFFAFLR
jgi:hypothetical protein